MPGFAHTLAPPYRAVIFTSRRNGSDAVGYDEASGRMLDLAQVQPGFLGTDSARGVVGLGITVSYWRDEASINDGREYAEQRATRKPGPAKWDGDFKVRIAPVERADSCGAEQ